MLIHPTPQVSILAAGVLAGQLPMVQFWSNATQQEPHMLPQTVTQLMLCRAAAVVQANGETIGIAGLFDARTKAGDLLEHGSRPIVEIGSAYVIPALRNHGLGTTLMRNRLAYCQAQGWPVVCVSTNPVTQHLCQSQGGTLIESMPDCHWLLETLCLCPTRSNGCKICPLAPKAAWIWFPA